MKKRTFRKTYGVIFNCLATRAVHIDLAADYSTEKFLMVLRRFVSIRGFPSNLYSDNGLQQVAANEELKNVVKGWNQEELKTFGVMEGCKWDFAPADPPWQNGVSEALVKSRGSLRYTIWHFPLHAGRKRPTHTRSLLIRIFTILMKVN